MKKEILIEVSARHVHVTREDMDKLFGKGSDLTIKKMLSQPGQFASEQKVSIVGPKKTIDNVSILGPFRKQTQVEISATDSRNLGLDAPLRESGNLKGSCGCSIIGPNGKIDINEGVIIAQRHVHLTPETAQKFCIKDKQILSVKVDSKQGRALIFGDVIARVSDTSADSMHIDTDEGNACFAVVNMMGEII